MAELRLIIAKDKTILIAKSPRPVDGVAPHASPIMSEPRFGSMNSALERVPNVFTVPDMALSRPDMGLRGIKTTRSKHDQYAFRAIRSFISFTFDKL
jgi:hypothetical protein